MLASQGMGRTLSLKSMPTHREAFQVNRAFSPSWGYLQEESPLWHSLSKKLKISPPAIISRTNILSIQYFTLWFIQMYFYCTYCSVHPLLLPLQGFQVPNQTQQAPVASTWPLSHPATPFLPLKNCFIACSVMTKENRKKTMGEKHNCLQNVKLFM